MKKILLTFILLFPLRGLGGFLFAQSGTMLPDGFIIPNLATAPACTMTDQGKMYYNTSTALMMVCDGTNWKTSVSQWGNNQALPNTINYGQGNVGINTITPQYRLDVNGTARVSGNFFTNNITIGSTTNGSGFEVHDGDIAIKSTVDAKTWKFDYSDVNNNLSLQEDGTARMIFANGGNVGIGSVIPTAKLSVDGTGSFSGNLTVNSGKGIVRSTTANALKTFITPKKISSMMITKGTCNTTTVDLTSAGFLAAPTAMIGNLISGTGNFIKLNISVQSTTTTTAVVRFCNNTDTDITLTNIIFNSLYIGQ